jgi:hypothetical protein
VAEVAAFSDEENGGKDRSLTIKNKNPVSVNTETGFLLCR